MSDNGSRGKLLVVGGGLSGITAAVEASEAGCEVVLVERNPHLGGRVAQLNQYFPKMCPPTCGLEINTRRIKTSPRIRCLTLAEVERISGEPGNYHVTVKQHARMVNSKCTACGACVDVCPVDRPDAFNYGMGSTRAIYLPFETAYPMQFAIDETVCPGAACGKCVPACPYDAIDLAMESETIELEVQAVIWATGWSPFDASRIDGLGFGTYPDVITNVMLERLASKGGPTAGLIRRPSNSGEIGSVAFVQCAGSRDENYLKHCSGACCLASLKQARYVREQFPDAEISIHYIDIRAPGRLEDFYAASQQDARLTLIKGKVAKVTAGGSGKLVIEAEDTMAGEMITREVDLVVLATGMVPADLSGIEIEAGLATDDHGFLAAEQPSGGFIAAGCSRRPTEASACVRDATGAVMKALNYCAR